VTPAGSRTLAQRLAAPLTDPGEIAHRLDAVAAFVADAHARADLRERLKSAPDLARALSRLVVGRGGPRDLAAIRDGILAASAIVERIAALGAASRDIQRALKALAQPEGALAAELSRSLADELPAFRRDGGFIRPGCEQALQTFRFSH